MKRVVEITIMGGAAYKTKRTAENVVITGRLLGAISNINATKIIQNQEVAERVTTQETVTLSDTLKGLDTIQNSGNGRDKFGRLVVAIKSMRAKSNPISLEVLTRQLYLSAPVTVVAETSKETVGTLQATLSCDDALITIYEKEKPDE